MYLEELKPGIHATNEEIEFAHTRALELREYGCNDRIKVVGGRSKGTWLSRKFFALMFHQENADWQKRWYDFLNQKAKEMGLYYNQMFRLAEILPADTPFMVTSYLRGDHIASDLDLSISKRPERVTFCKIDQITGLPVEIWGDGEYKKSMDDKIREIFHLD